MTLRFSNDGPEFPGNLVDALLAGEVVFLCGTGISALQMPGFAALVEETYESLAVKKTDSEELAFKKGLYEEVLGSLSRRLADPSAVTRIVSELLAVPEDPRLEQHRTILRLSRDLDNRICVVTTNFDTLLERVAAEAVPDASPAGVSFAGQALPAPGSPSFSGVIHIHGRLADRELKIEPTPLVLMSADYGDAYMRSGWASRFLFDLARCKTIVLIGYSANDAPVRYFLNVLEADRARFPDLKPVYAFDSYEGDPEKATASWGTLAVTPLPYSKTNAETGASDHSPLWRDLEALAEVTERPKRARRERAGRILENAFADTDGASRRELAWLFRERRDVWSDALDAIADPAWFDFFQNEGLWSAREAVWVVAAWIARDFEDRYRLAFACEWQRRQGQPFTEKIKQRLLHAEGLDETWKRIWRYFCLIRPDHPSDQDFYAIRRRLESEFVLDNDLREAVSFLAPGLRLSARPPSPSEGEANQGTQGIRRHVRPRMTISRQASAQEIVETLCEMPNRAGRIVELATAELRSVLELEVELELIGEEHDPNDYTVPSIESHAQNRYREGVNVLVRVIVESLSHATASSREETRRLVAGWKNLPGRTGLRLCLHAMRDLQLFESDEAMSMLLSTSAVDFWAVRRECRAPAEGTRGSRVLRARELG